ncbi:MAG: hypothetical protein AABX55_01500 [Nanoarchaeota archaeon]
MNLLDKIKEFFEKEYYCDHPSHFDDTKVRLKKLYSLDNTNSIYYFCENCISLYKLENEKLLYVDKDELEKLPVLKDKSNIPFIPADLLEGEPD